MEIKGYCKDCEMWDSVSPKKDTGSCAEFSDLEDSRIRYTQSTDYCSYFMPRIEVTTDKTTAN